MNTKTFPYLLTINFNKKIYIYYMNAKPFLKWVGGKTQLLEDINSNFPESLDHIETYIEPFVGGGAVMFDIVPKMKNVKTVIINDLNSKLINVYRNIKDNHELLITKLIELETEYLNYNKKGKEEMFYLIREKFNEHKKIYSDKDPVFYINNAVYFIFLNKTCFNGLYRENAQGLFNTPWNKAMNPLICDIKNITAVSEFLNKYNVEILCGDYKEIEKYADENTFVYFDPPYRPISNTSAFTSYTKSKFNDDDQKQLKMLCDRLNKKKCLIMLSNSDSMNSNPPDPFFDDLYREYYITKLFARRNINSKGDKRNKITEILVTNYNTAEQIDMVY